MGKEINLLEKYPQSSRDVSDRGITKTEKDCRIAQKFGREFFDGSRRHGYGGFSYNPRFWGPVIPVFQKHWGLQAGDSLLDIGCAKGFMLYDLQRLISGLKVTGIDISKYAIANAKIEVKDFCHVGNAIEIPFENKSMEVVTSITTLHNLGEEDIVLALSEIERVKKRASFITVDAYRNEYEKERMESWNLTAKTVMHVDKWKQFFRDVGYTGDYFWFTP